MMNEFFKDKWLIFTIIFSLLYSFALYFQGLYIFLNPNLLHNYILRDPDLPFLLKLSDEFLLIPLFAILSHGLFKDTFNKSDSFLIILLSSFFFFTGFQLLYKDDLFDLTGLSVIKTLLTLFIGLYLYKLNLNNYAYYFRISAKVITIILFVSQIVGLLYYYLVQYSVYGDRLIGLSLNPNFNAAHCLFLLVIIMFSNMKLYLKWLLLPFIFYCFYVSASIASYVILFLFFVMSAVFARFKNPFYFEKILQNAFFSICTLAVIVVFSFLTRSWVLYFDYGDKLRVVFGPSVNLVLNPKDATRRTSLGKHKTPHASIGDVNISTTKEVRINDAKKIFEEMFAGNNVNVFLFGTQGRYTQTDSSILNITYNFGIIGFLLFICNLYSVIKLLSMKNLNSFRDNIVFFILSQPLILLSVCIVFVGGIFQQYIESWSVLILLVLSLFLYDEKSIEVKESNVAISKNGRFHE